MYVTSGCWQSMTVVGQPEIGPCQSIRHRHIFLFFVTSFFVTSLHCDASLDPLPRFIYPGHPSHSHTLLFNMSARLVQHPDASRIIALPSLSCSLSSLPHAMSMDGVSVHPTMYAHCAAESEAKVCQLDAWHAIVISPILFRSHSFEKPSSRLPRHIHLKIPKEYQPICDLSIFPYYSLHWNELI
jgi:hypothetical protein